jgi:adenylate kinase
MRIVLLGAPGSGKGTQGDKIVANYGVNHISTGEVLRAEVGAGTELGRKAKAIMDAGELVSDDIILAIAKAQITKSADSGGFMLDGFPRTLPQAEGLDAILEELKQPLDAVVLLEVDSREVMDRLMARKRADDNEETIANRLRVYEEQTAPLIEYYRAQGKLRAVQGVGDVEAIFARVSSTLDSIA